MSDNKKVNLLIEEDGYRITLNPNSSKPEKFISHAYGSYFTACDIELVSSIDCDAREWDTLSTKMKQGFSCRGITTDGWDMGVIGDDFKTTDLMVSIYPKDPVDVKHMAQWEKAKREKVEKEKEPDFPEKEEKVSDVMFGKVVADWEIPNSNTYFWIQIDVSQEVFDSLLSQYKEGNLLSLRFRVTFNFAQVYKSQSSEYMPLVEPDTYYLLPHKDWGIDIPEIAYGKLDTLNTSGKRITLRPHRNDLEDYYEEKIEAESQAREARERGEYTPPPAANFEQEISRNLVGINTKMLELNSHLKYILYALAAIAVVIFLLKG